MCEELDGDSHRGDMETCMAVQMGLLAGSTVERVRGHDGGPGPGAVSISPVGD